MQLDIKKVVLGIILTLVVLIVIIKVAPTSVVQLTNSSAFCLNSTGGNPAECGGVTTSGSLFLAVAGIIFVIGLLLIVLKGFKLGGKR